MKAIGDVLGRLTQTRFVELAQDAERLEKVNARMQAADIKRSSAELAESERQKTAEMGLPEYRYVKNALRKLKQREWIENGQAWQAQQAAAALRADEKELIICAWCGCLHIYPVRRFPSYENTHCFMCRAAFDTAPSQAEQARAQYVRMRANERERVF